MVATAAALRLPPPAPETSPAWAPEERSPVAPAVVFEAGLNNHHLANTAYPIAHARTIWSYRQGSDRHAERLAASFGAAGRMSLYAHLPFCERRCAYCEYCVIEGHDPVAEERYCAALMAELDLYDRLLGFGGRTLAGFDIGGGTPSLVDPALVGALVKRVTGAFKLAPGFDISIETTPRVAATHPERLSDYRSFGIDRISMGLQMVSPRLLRRYDRDLNTVGHNGRAVEAIRRAGFSRLNIDVMYGFADQTTEDLLATLEHTLALGPEYVTLYRMRYKGTRIASEARAVELSRVVEMYGAARALLAERGYPANPGKNGFSRLAGDPGTSAYLTERVVRSTPYLGVGLGAQTFTNHVLAYNLGAAEKRTDRYLAAVGRGELPIQDLYWLPRGEAMAKMVSVAFYFGEVNLEAFRACFGEDLAHRFPDEVAFVLERGLMERSGPNLSLTAAGAKVWNGVVALFYSDRVKRHLVDLEEE